MSISLPLSQRLFRRCAALPAGLLTALITGAAILLALPIGLGVWEILVWAGAPILSAMIVITTVIVAVPLAGFVALTLAWGWERQNGLRRQEALLLSAQRMAKLGHWRWLCGTDYYLLSEDICYVYGVAPDDPRLPLDRLFEIMHPDDHAATHEALRVLIEERQPQEVEYRIRGGDGVWRTIWVDGWCEYDAEGHVIAMFGVIQDITERKRIETDLRRALERVEVASRAKSDFLASMSHELRTPLNAVLGFSEMIRDERLGALANRRYVEYAGDIHDSGAHLLALIDGLLDVSKIEAGRYDLCAVELDLGGAIERAARVVRSAAARKAQRIDVDLSEPSPMALADEKALHQILLNLLSNAIKFSHAGGVIQVRASVNADGAAVQVEDHGIGIPDDKLAHVGQPFFQAHAGSARIAGGTGIGLSVTRALVELHGGTLAVASRHGVGTTVTVTLPASRTRDRANPAAGSPAR